MAGYTRSGRGSWSCASSCFCWSNCVGVRGGRLPTNARRLTDNSPDSESGLGREHGRVLESSDKFPPLRFLMDGVMVRLVL